MDRSLLSHFLLDHNPNLLTIDPSLIRIPETYTFAPGAWEPNGSPPVPSVPKPTPQVQQSTPTTQGLSQATDDAINLSPATQTPNSSLTQSITPSDVKHLGSDETKHNEGTPQKSKDDDEDNNPTPKGMSPQDLNPSR